MRQDKIETPDAPSRHHLHIKPLNKLAAIMPANILNKTVLPLVLEVGRILFHHLVPLSLSHRGRLNVKTIR